VWGNLADRTIRRRLALLIAAASCWLLCSLLAPAGAGAQEPTPTSPTVPPTSTTSTTEPEQTGSGEQIRGTLVDKKETRDTDDDEALAGVRVTVTDQSGKDVGDDVTDDEGKFEVDLPGPGTYSATLDVEDLPEGIELDEQDAVRTVTVNPGQRLPLIFDIAGAARRIEGRLDLLLQALVDGAYLGLIIAMAAVGLSLIYGTTGLVNFAHGELVTLGAMLAYWLHITIGWKLVIAAPCAVVLSALAGWLIDAGFWGPLRRRGTGNIAQMVISIGVALALVNVYLYFFESRTLPYADYHAQRAWTFGTIDLPPKKAVSAIICVVLLVAVAVALQRTRTGKAMRAISDNPDLAASSGINVDGVIRLVWFFGAGLAGLGGILFSISQDVNFEQGSSMLLLLFAAVTLGGLGEAYGALIGGVVIGLFINVSTVWLSPELKNVGALAVLVVVLLVRPQGILGHAERVG